jgi:hypothetical protein
VHCLDRLCRDIVSNGTLQNPDTTAHLNKTDWLRAENDGGNALAYWVWLRVIRPRCR